MVRIPVYDFPTIHFEPPKEENLSTKNKLVEFMSSPKCPLCGGSTAKTLYMIRYSHRWVRGNWLLGD